MFAPGDKWYRKILTLILGCGSIGEEIKVILKYCVSNSFFAFLFIWHPFCIQLTVFCSEVSNEWVEWGQKIEAHTSLQVRWA